MAGELVTLRDVAVRNHLKVGMKLGGTADVEGRMEGHLMSKGSHRGVNGEVVM